jgi:hypothetical protein
MGSSITATASTGSILTDESSSILSPGCNAICLFFLLISPSSLGNPSALSLSESLLPMPVGLLCGLGLFRLIADMLWGYLDFAWGYQLDSASL